MVGVRQGLERVPPERLLALRVVAVRLLGRRRRVAAVRLAAALSVDAATGRVAVSGAAVGVDKLHLEAGRVAREGRLAALIAGRWADQLQRYVFRRAGTFGVNTLKGVFFPVILLSKMCPLHVSLATAELVKATSRL